MERNDPVIILGMHRSGTSLVAELVELMGVFLGNDLNVHSESKSYLKLNEQIFNFAHAYWDYPGNIEKLILEDKSIKNVMSFLKNETQNFNFSRNYWGIQRLLKTPKGLWGWKEPRTTVTFPLWHEIYPNAKYIFIVRNGVDVAQSLMHREKSRLGEIHSKVYSLRCLEFVESYTLWEEYNSIFEKYCHLMNSKNIFRLRYEDLLSDPELILNQLSMFLKLEIPCSLREEIISKLEIKNGFKFIKSKILYEAYSQIKNRELMRTYKYNDIMFHND